MGWLLGDTGSGYWIGHQVVRAVVAALDGRAPKTALTDLLLTSLQLEATSDRLHGRPLALMQLIEVLYAIRPIKLARFAPLAFQVQDDDVARGILMAAASALADTLAAVRDPGVDGPVVLGGSVLGSGILAGASPLAPLLKAELGQAEFIPVLDGVVGAAVVGLHRAGIPVDAAVFHRIKQSVAELRKKAKAV
jgi:N-acetylglucosamine kinase-like BadF-type ATPase